MSPSTGSGITRSTAAELAARIASGEVSSVDVTQAHLDRITDVDDAVHAFLYVDTDRALAQAAAVDTKVAAGDPVGPLAGVPLALKDVLTYAGAPTTCGSKILEGWLPPYSATVTERLLAADIVILGKTNMDEFAMGPRPRTPRTGRRTTRGTWTGSRVAPGAARRLRWPRSRRRWPSAPTPVARSVSRPP